MQFVQEKIEKHQFHQAHPVSFYLPGSQELVHVKGTYFWRSEYKYTLLRDNFTGRGIRLI